jgi:choloylglycine hydrolase
VTERKSTKRRFARTLAAIISAGALMLASAADACTGIRLIAADGTVVHARTLEFAIDIQSNVIVSPRGFARVGSTPDGKDGLTWKAKYASVGANAIGLPVIIDGLNEAGLAAGLFYFPTTAGYMAYEPAKAGKTIAPWQLASWVLDNFKSIDEVKANIGSIVVAPTVLKQWGFVPPVHMIVHDETGKSIVIEYVGGKLNVYDDPLGIITNSPGFDWHMTNLRNYVNFSLDNRPPVQLGSVTLEPFGQGSGMLGMPGDFTPPSRFVRAAAFSQSALQPKTGDEAVLTAFHILNNFDIPKGSTRDPKKDEHGNIVADYTLWTSANDLKAKRFYFRTYENSRIRMVDLKKMNLDAKAIVTFPMSGEETIERLNP